MSTFSVTRIAIALAIMLASWSGWPMFASADETTIEFDVFNAGSLSVAWSGGDGAFLAGGVEPAVSSTSPPVVASAEFVLTISDTRADGERLGYAIAVSASQFTADGSLTPLGPQQLSIAAVSSDAGLQLLGANQTLASPVTILAVDDEAPAIEVTITIKVNLTIFAGTMPGDYAGRLTLEVLPAMAD